MILQGAPFESWSGLHSDTSGCAGLCGRLLVSSLPHLHQRDQFLWLVVLHSALRLGYRGVWLHTSVGVCLIVDGEEEDGEVV